METNRIIKLSLSNARLCFAKRAKRKERKEEKEGKGEGEKTKKAEREKYKNTENEKTKKKKSIFSRTLESRFRLVTFLSFLSYTYSFLPLHPPDPASFERCKPRCARKTVYSIFNTPFYHHPQPIFLSSSPSPSLFKYSKILFFPLPSSLYPHPRLFRFEKWFHLCEFDRSFCPGERAEYFDEPDFQGKSFQRNWLGEREILKKKREKREGGEIRSFWRAR